MRTHSTHSNTRMQTLTHDNAPTATNCSIKPVNTYRARSASGGPTSKYAGGSKRRGFVCCAALCSQLTAMTAKVPNTPMPMFEWVRQAQGKGAGLHCWRGFVEGLPSRVWAIQFTNDCLHVPTPAARRLLHKCDPLTSMTGKLPHANPPMLNGCSLACMLAITEF